MSAQNDSRYDPYIPSGNASSDPSGGGANFSNSKTARIHSEIDNTISIMRDNINKGELWKKKSRRDQGFGMLCMVEETDP